MTPAETLERFIEKYSPEVGAVARAALRKMRTRMPGAVELVYDNYNALAIAFGSSQRLTDVVFSIALYPRWVSLFFKAGASLPDPKRRLKGSGKVMRHIVLASAKTLDEPDVRTLMKLALEAAAWPSAVRAKRLTIIKSVSAKQRPRRAPQ